MTSATKRKDPFVADALVVKRRQQQDAGAAVFDRLTGQLRAVGDRAAARARQQLRRGYTALDERIQQALALLQTQRCGFTGGAERRECRTAAAQQSLRVRD